MSCLCEWCRREGEDVRKNEAVAVDPVGVLGVEGHELVEQDVGHGGHAHGGTRVARVGLEGGIDLQSGGGSAIEAEEVGGSCWGGRTGAAGQTAVVVGGMRGRLDVPRGCGWC